MKWMNTQLVGASSPYHIMSLDNESLLDRVYDPLREHQHFYVCWKQDPTYPSSPYEDLGFIEEGKSILKKRKFPISMKRLKGFSLTMRTFKN